MLPGKPMLMHSTYFDLGPNNSPDIIHAFMAEALDYLSASKGMISFWIGERAADMTRPQNDSAHDIAMHQLFKDQDSFNLYNGSDPKHEQFVADVNRWTPSTTRRVMDTYLHNLITGGNASVQQSIGADGNLPQSLFHSLYFSLADKSPGSVEKFSGLCVQFLSRHPGIQQFTTGGLTDIKRDVSFRDFDVAVDIIYESKKAYDEYQQSQGHADFFPATAGMIDKTFVFDSYLSYQTKVYSVTR